MKQGMYRFCTSVFLFWLVAAWGGHVLVMPEKVATLSACLPPILGLMWGPVAAVGCWLGGVLAEPALGDFLAGDGSIGRVHFLLRSLWVFLAGFLPCFFWHRWHVAPGKNPFPVVTATLWKIVAIMFATFAVTAVFCGLTATEEELEATAFILGSTSAGWRLSSHMLACFINDVSLVFFFDMVWFFFLVSGKYPFYLPGGGKAPEDGKHHWASLSSSGRIIWFVALGFYATFPIGVVYLNRYQIYGMNDMGTWMRFCVECVSLMDVAFVLMLYLLLRYHRSIMLEIVFLVATTVFLSAAVLGWGSSVAMGNLVQVHVDDSLEAMSLICRERLERTFFCVRQAVNGMAQQAVDSIESYERLTEDAAYREAYYRDMEQRFNAIAYGTDGCMAFYLRLAPEIDGPLGGFSMGREEIRWEGALPPFVRRTSVDLFQYDSADVKNVGWYYLPIKSHHGIWIEPYVDPTAKEYVISYVVPIYVEGRCVGVIGMDVDFGFIIQELRRMSIYNYGYVYITNRNGRVLYHKDQEQGSLFKPNPEYQEIDIFLTNGMWLGVALPLSRAHADRNSVIMHMVAAILVVAMLISLMSIVLASRAIRPLAGMTEAAQRIASGDLNVKLSYESGNELGLLVRSIREMAAKLEVYVYRDKLTGLRNAASYMSKGAELDERMEEDPNIAYGVVIFDANFLKRINDTYGHEAGNDLIRHAAQVICRVFAHSPVYRTGGDEFAAILEGQDYENREALLQRFDEEAAKEHFEAGGKHHGVSVARGLAIYAPGMDYKTVAKCADDAMYNHKTALKVAMGEDLR